MLRRFLFVGNGQVDPMESEEGRLLRAPFPATAAVAKMLRASGWTKKFTTKRFAAEAMRRSTSRATLVIASFDAQALTITCAVRLKPEVA